MPDRSAGEPAQRRLATFARSSIAGGAATLVDLAVLGASVGLLHLSPRAANVPALLAGAAVQFVGNRHFAFRASAGSLGRQLALFAATEAAGLALGAALFDVLARLLAPGTAGALALRLATTCVVYVGWSYPAWQRVFRPPQRPRPSLGADASGR